MHTRAAVLVAADSVTATLTLGGGAVFGAGSEAFADVGSTAILVQDGNRRVTSGLWRMIQGGSVWRASGGILRADGKRVPVRKPYADFFRIEEYRITIRIKMGGCGKRQRIAHKRL